MGLLKAASKYQPVETKGVEITDEYREVFVVEAREHLDEWESALLELEHAPDDHELINQIFRAIHTLKGSAGFIGFEDLQHLSHDLESTLQTVRDGEQPLTAVRTEFLFKGLDMSKRMVEAFEDGTESNEDVEGFLRRLAESEGELPENTPQEAPPVAQAPPAAPVARAAASAPTDRSSSGENRKLVLEVFVDSTGREAFLRAFLLRNRIASVATILGEEPAPETLKDSTGKFNYRITLLTDRDDSEIQNAANIDQIELVSLEKAEEPQAAHVEAEPVGKRERSASQETRSEKVTKHDEVVRVSVERLDNLLNLVGELVVQNSNFTSLSEEFSEVYGRADTVLKLLEKTEGLAKITRDLQDGIMKVRMLPVNTVFMRFHRVVRDLAHSSRKDVNLDIFGGDTELDKKVIDKIGDPLVHLIRNAVDHGIEDRERRAKAGKPPTSSVRLGAYQDGDHICIEVSDDGKGLDQQAILKKAREKGLINEGDKLTDDQILDLIFQPGFSTAERITDVSGRGVGMDAVKQAIEALGGSIRIRSFVGRGTTVTITLPLTMAIIRAVLVEIRDLTVAIPLSAVKEVLKVAPSETNSVGQRQVIRLREEVLALVDLSEVLELQNRERRTAEDDRFPVIVVDYEGQKIGLGVERVIGTNEIVIKSLSRHYREVEGFIGASILGDGRIALIVDVEAIVSQYHHGGTSAKTSYRDNRTPEAKSELRAVSNASEPDSFSVASELPEESEQLEAEIQNVTNTADLYERASDVLAQVGSSGALRASMALSQITGTEVLVGFPESSLVKITDIAEMVGGEEAQIAGIYVGVTGGLQGGILIAMPADKVPVIHSYLHGHNGSVNGESLDMSTIAEFGNLLGASFINAIGDETEIRTQIEPPEISVDMCLSVMDSVVARFNTPGDDTLLTKAEVMFGEEDQVGCNLLLFLEPESLERLLTAFAVVSV